MRLRLIAAVLSLAVAPFARGEGLFNHDPASLHGPSFWGTIAFKYATCGSILSDSGGAFVEVGRRQSPVDILAPVEAPLAGLSFLYTATAFEVENNGHAIEVPYEPGSLLRIGQDVYELRQFHFHAPSEHAVNGKLADLEVHLVHQNALGDLAVVGVLFQLGLPPNALVDAIMEAALTGESAARALAPTEGKTLDATALLPQTRGYFTYSGSLTTPPCSEGVRWIVLEERVGVSPRALDIMHALVARFPGYDGFPNNNRPVQNLNGRAVLHRAR